jgi:formylglycine-generating enzyme required for sulfatase activity
MAAPTRALALVAMLLACEPAMLATTVKPAAGWPDLAQPGVGRLDGRRDAALIVAIEDPRLGGREGAEAVASAWWRYLVEARGLRARNVVLLRDGEATAAAIREALDRLEWQAGSGSLAWVVFIGSGESLPDSEGVLLTARGTLGVGELRERLGFGLHESAFVLLDACTATPAPYASAGVPAAPPRGTAQGEAELADDRAARLSHQIEGQRAAFDGSSAGLLDDAIADAKRRAQADLDQASALPRNLVVLASGVGPRCAASLAGRPWPALAYASLEGLRGGADLDADGWIGASELALHAQALIGGEASTSGAGPALEIAGVDLILADVAGHGPRPRRLARTRAPVRELMRASAAALTAAREQLGVRLEAMVAVPAGRFWMGCDRSRDPGCEPDESPERLVDLGGYAIDRTEVPWRDYRACVDAGRCPAPQLDRCWVWTGLDAGFVEGAPLPAAMLADDHPVVCVSWDEAQHFCGELGMRLPTEAEWERAARGVDRRIHPWGDEAPDCTRAVLDGCGGTTAAVGTHPAGASPVGALDMAGNVFEWIHDWWDERGYGRYAMPSAHDPSGPSDGEVRGVRGGSYYSGEQDLRAGYRYGLDPHARLGIVGFRCAR